MGAASAGVGHLAYLDRPAAPIPTRLIVKTKFQPPHEHDGWREFARSSALTQRNPWWLSCVVRACAACDACRPRGAIELAADARCSGPWADAAGTWGRSRHRPRRSPPLADLLGDTEAGHVDVLLALVAALRATVMMARREQGKDPSLDRSTTSIRESIAPILLDYRLGSQPDVEQLLDRLVQRQPPASSGAFNHLCPAATQRTEVRSQSPCIE